MQKRRRETLQVDRAARTQNTWQSKKKGTAEKQERTQADDAISHAVREKWQRDIPGFPAKRVDLYCSGFECDNMHGKQLNLLL